MCIPRPIHTYIHLLSVYHLLIHLSRHASCLSSNHYIYLNNPLCMHLLNRSSICLLIHPFISPSMHLSTHPSMHPSIHASIHASIPASIHASIHASMHPSIHPCIYPCIYP